MATRAATGPRPNRTPTPVRVIARDRAYQAHQLRLAGADWAEVAARTGYADGRVASLAVTAFLPRTALPAATTAAQSCSRPASGF